MQYLRDGEVVVDGTFRAGDSVAYWDATVSGNHVRIERSIEGIRAGDQILRVWINGTEVPDYGNRFLSIWGNLPSHSAESLEESFENEHWVQGTLELLNDPDRYYAVSEEFVNLISRWRTLLEERGGATDGGWDCFWCTINILAYIAEAGLVLAVGAPTGGAALAAWLIARYSTIAAGIASCTLCLAGGEDEDPEL